MVTETVFLQDLAVVVVIAAATSVVFQRLRFPLVFGLLAAGVIIGPNTPPFELVQSEETLRTLAEVGIVLLLFGLGLDFELRVLRRVGGAAALITTVEVLLMFWLGFEVSLMLGWSTTDALFMGAMLGISSTAIIVTTLRELGRLGEESSRILFGVLVLEDVAAILILVLLSGFAETGGLVLDQAVLVLAQMLVFLLALLLFGLLLVPRFVDHVAKAFRPEVLLLVVVGLGIGAAVVSDVFGFHAGLGAFLMGTVMAEAKRRHEVANLIKPVHDLFMAIFFVSIGTLVDFQVLAEFWQPVMIFCGILVLGKLVGGALPTLLAGYGAQTAIAVGAALAQIGEFSFVIAALGLSTGQMSPYLFSIIVGAAAVTSLTSPLTIRYGKNLGQLLARVTPRALRTYGHVYAAWMRRARSDTAGRTTAVLRKARRGAIVAAVLAAVVMGAAVFLQTASVELLVSVGASANVAPLVHWGLTAALLAPALYEVVQNVRRWVEAARPVRMDARRLGARIVVQYTILLIVLLAVGLAVIVATAPFFDNTLILLGWLVLVAILAAVLWTQIRRLHGRLEETVGRLLEEEHMPADVPEVIESLYQGPFPLELGTATVTVGPDHWVAGQSLAQIGLRAATGASLVLVERATGDQEVATPATTILPGDRLTLMGSPDELGSASAILHRERPAGEVHRELRPGRIEVAGGSELAGKTLREASLRIQYGVQVVAVLRQGQAHQNPDPDERIQAADVLIVVGEDKDITRLQDAVKAPAAEPSA